jgi:hypothetical protein
MRRWLWLLLRGGRWNGRLLVGSPHGPRNTDAEVGLVTTELDDVWGAME